ncbi:MAG: hypothetical protein KDC07_00780 [Chitinophagaceae bacterium]|nr:hypothetical protein [Chitinophagaceae bacterium]MCB9044628.1 hypothetical protein [Chitinophagales bacterium]
MDIDFREQLRTKTDAELRDIYINREDYQQSFWQQAEQEVRHRNLDTSAWEITRQEILEQEHTTLSQADDQSPWYILVVFVIPFFTGKYGAVGAGIVGAIWGARFAFSKRTGRDGTRYYKYSTRAQQAGVFVFVASLVSLFWGLLMLVT